MQAQRRQDLRAQPVLPQRMWRCFFARVQFHMQIAQQHQCATPFIGDQLHGIAKFVTPPLGADTDDIQHRVQRMHPYQHGVRRGDITLDQRDMFGPLGFIDENPHLPVTAEFGCDGLAVAQHNQIIMAAAIGDQIADRADLQPVQLRKGDQIGQTRHFAVFFHDLADHARRVQPRQTADIDSGLGMAGTDKHTAIARAQREHMAWRGDIGRPLGGVNRDRDGARTVGGRNAGADAFAGLDADGERCFMAR